MTDAKYWLVKVGQEYMVDSGCDYTPLKTKAGRLRDSDREALRLCLEKANVRDVKFMPTTYKPTGTEFIEPRIWWWINRPRDKDRPYPPDEV